MYSRDVKFCCGFIVLFFNRGSQHHASCQKRSLWVQSGYTLWIQVPPKKILYPANYTLSAFLAADPWIHRDRFFVSLDLSIQQTLSENTEKHRSERDSQNSSSTLIPESNQNPGVTPRNLGGIGQHVKKLQRHR